MNWTVTGTLSTSQDNLTRARSTFGVTYPIARSAALVLHLDIALILFRKYGEYSASVDTTDSILPKLCVEHSSRSCVRHRSMVWYNLVRTNCCLQTDRC